MVDAGDGLMVDNGDGLMADAGCWASWLRFRVANGDKQEVKGGSRPVGGVVIAVHYSGRCCCSASLAGALRRSCRGKREGGAAVVGGWAGVVIVVG
ncbi:hypothetical protein Dimus_030140, partial [Dionaea muscipula]